MGTGRKDTDGVAINIKGIKLTKKLRRIRPGGDSDFTSNSVGVNDLPRFQKLLFH